MLSEANAITALLADEFVDVPVELPAHGDIENEPCAQFHFERRRGRFVEVLVAASGVYTVLHIGGTPQPPVKLLSTQPHRVAEMVRVIS